MYYCLSPLQLNRHQRTSKATTPTEHRMAEHDATPRKPILPTIPTAFQNPPYRHEGKYDESYQIAHVTTTALSHHSIYPPKSTTKKPASIQHLPLHSTDEVVLTSHLAGTQIAICKMQNPRRPGYTEKNTIRIQHIFQNSDSGLPWILAWSQDLHTTPSTNWATPNLCDIKEVTHFVNHGKVAQNVRLGDTSEGRCSPLVQYQW